MVKFFKSGKFSFILGLLLIAVVFIICGTMLLTSAEFMLVSADLIFSIVLIVLGVYLILSFLFFSKSTRSLSLGLTAILVGCLVRRIPGLFSAFAPAFWSFAIIYGGFNLLRVAIDLRRADFEKWWVVLIFSVLTVILGIICVLDPIGIAIANTQLIGISLLADAAFNIAAAVFTFIFVSSDDFLRVANKIKVVTAEAAPEARPAVEGEKAETEKEE